MSSTLEKSRRLLRHGQSPGGGDALAWSVYLWPVLLWGPSLLHGGLLLFRDPAFFATYGADLHSSLGVVSPKGDWSNLTSQGLFYAPYALVAAVLGGVGVDGYVMSRVIPFAVSVIGVSGMRSLLTRLGHKGLPIVIGTGFFLLNPWSLDQVGYFFLWSGYCLLPWIVITSIEYINGRGNAAAMPILLMFSGGLVAWVIQALAILTCLVLAGPLAATRVRSRRRCGAGLAWRYIVASAYWVLPYALWAVRSRAAGYRSFTRASSGLLQTGRPLLDLLTLRDFWWPHLNPLLALGPQVYALSNLASELLVLSVAVYVLFLGGWGNPSQESAFARDHVFGAFMVLGAILALGSAGPTGRIYLAIHSWTGPAHSLVSGLTRSPSNFLALFVFGLSVGVSAVCRGALASSVCRKAAAAGAIVIVSALSVLPSLVAAWFTYRPVTLPSYYSRLARRVPPGLTLEVAPWSDAAVLPASGVAHFVWSGAVAADPTVLASEVPAPSLSPLDPAVLRLDNSIVYLAARPDGKAIVLRDLSMLHVRSIVVENDLVLDRPSPMLRFVKEIQSFGLTTKRSGPLVIASVPHRISARQGKPMCYSVGYLGNSIVHLSCPTGRGGEARLSLGVGRPLAFVGKGIRATSVDGIELEVILGSRSGWVISLPGVLATAGLLTSSSVSAWCLFGVRRSRS